MENFHNEETIALSKRFIRLNANSYYCDIWLSNGKPQITSFYKEGILNLLVANGFAKTAEGLYIRNVNNIITVVKALGVQQFVKEYVYSYPPESQYLLEQQLFIEKAENLRNLFLEQVHLIANNTFLSNLPTIYTVQLKDNLNSIRLPFKNGIVSIKKNGYEVVPYSKLERYHIFEEQIIQHEVSEADGQMAQFEKFIHNICNGEPEKIDAFESTIGYLIHNYRDSANNKMVICYDLEVSEPGVYMGGTGKGIFANGIGFIRLSTIINGKKFDGKDKFAFQEVTPSTQVIVINDIGANFEIESLNSLVTDGFNVEQKGKQSYTIKQEDAPKVLITSNIVLEYRGTTNKRRQIILPFSNYYSSKLNANVSEPVVAEHGGRLFDDWGKQEWNRFYQYIIKCGVKYLSNGLKLLPIKDIARNKLIQDTSLEFVLWIEGMQLEPSKRYNTKELFNEFKSQYHPDEDFKQRTFSNWLKKFGASIGFVLRFVREDGNEQFMLSQINI